MSKATAPSQNGVSLVKEGEETIVSRMYRKNKTERGQALILVVLAIVGLAGMVGLVVDGGNVFLDRRKAQNAADAAALAAALSRTRSGENPQASALGSATDNGYNNNGSSNTVQFYNPPISGPNVGNSEYVQVIITSHVKTYFARILGWKQVTNRVEAVARTKTPEIRQILDGQAIISLAPESDCNKNKAFWVHGEATLSITGGGIFVNSKSDQCAFIQQGSGSVRMGDNHLINVVGAAMVQKPQLITPGVSVGAMSITYPPPFFMPKVGCKGKEATVSPDGTTMTPGSWDEQFPPEGVSHLEAGVYCLNDGVEINHDITGHNVLLYVEHGDVHFNGEANIILDAPNGGDYTGLLMFVPMNNHDKVVLNGGADSKIKGTILAPASAIHINGNDSSSGFHSQIIGYTVDVNGDSNVVIVYEDDQNFNTMTMPEVQLSE